MRLQRTNPPICHSLGSKVLNTVRLGYPNYSIEWDIPHPNTWDDGCLGLSWSISQLIPFQHSEQGKVWDALHLDTWDDGCLVLVNFSPYWEIYCLIPSWYSGQYPIPTFGKVECPMISTIFVTLLGRVQIFLMLLIAFSLIMRVFFVLRKESIKRGKMIAFDLGR